MVWDIDTKFSPVVVLMSFQLSTKFEGHNSLKKTAMPLGSSKWKWAWRAHFLSHTYETQEICCFLADVQIILVSLFEFFDYIKVAKNAGASCFSLWIVPWAICPLIFNLASICCSDYIVGWTFKFNRSYSCICFNRCMIFGCNELKDSLGYWLSHRGCKNQLLQKANKYTKYLFYVYYSWRNKFLILSFYRTH